MKLGMLLIVPGWLHTSREWARAQEELPEWDVHVIDLPGFGVEPLVSKDWGVPEYAEWTRNKIQESCSRERNKNSERAAEKFSQKTASEPASDSAVGKDVFERSFSVASTPVSKTVLLGHSFGGRVLTHILGSEMGTVPISPDMLILYAAPCLYRPRLGVRVRTFLARTATRIGIARMLPERLKPYDLREAADAGMAEIFKRSVPYSQEALLGHIHVPTHIVWGAEDASVPVRIAREMQTLIPHSHLTVLPHEGHNIHLDNPTLLFGTVRKILAAV